MKSEQKPLITKGTTKQVGNLHLSIFSIENDHVLVNVNGRLENFSFSDIEKLFLG